MAGKTLKFMNQSKKKEKQAISLAMAILGRQGGKSKSKKKSEAARKSLEKARQSRWPKQDA